MCADPLNRCIASNYSMQCLSSPTRKEIDKAHARRAWLDVGVPSFRNLRRLSTTRIVLWWLLALSSIPLHLLYNSTVFATLSTQEYSVFLVSSDFPTGAPFNVTPGSIFDSGSGPSLQPAEASTILHNYQHNISSLTKWDNEECIKVYTSSFISTHSDVLLVSTNLNSTNSFLIAMTDRDSPVLPSGYLSNQWMCAMPNSVGVLECQSKNPAPDPHNWTVHIQLDDPYKDDGSTIGDHLSIDQTTVQYCLSQPVKEQCKAQFSLGIMITVLICNLIKVICMSIIVWKQDPEPLVTFGDAVASFLEQPDPTTKDISLHGTSRFKSDKVWDSNVPLPNSKPSRWYQTISKRRWLICNGL